VASSMAMRDGFFLRASRGSWDGHALGCDEQELEGAVEGSRGGPGGFVAGEARSGMRATRSPAAVSLGLVGPWRAMSGR